MKKGYSLVLATGIISGFSIFINKFGVGGINPYVFAWLKNLSVLFLLTGIVFLFKNRTSLKSLSKKQWLLLAVIGLLGGSIPFLLFFKGLSLTTAAKGAFFHKTMFIYVAFLAFFFLKERINKRFLIGALLLFLGNLLLLKKIPSALNYGDLLILLATLFWAAESIVSKYALKDLSGKTVAWGRMFFGSLFIFAFLFSTGNLSLVSNLTFSQASWIMLTSVFLFGYVLTWYSGLKYIPVSHAVSILLVGSSITTLLSLMSGIQVGFQSVLSGVLIAFGIIFVVGTKEIWKQVKEVIYVRT